MKISLSALSVFVVPRLAVLALCLVSSAGVASAQVIISDTFDRNGTTLDGTAADVGGENWTVASNGGGTISTSTTGGGSADSTGGSDGTSVNGIIDIPTAYLTGTNGSLKNGVYTLSLTMSTPDVAPGSGAAGILFGLGHFNNNTTDPWDANTNNDNVGMGNINLLESSGSYSADVYAGPVLNPSGVSSSVGLVTGSSVSFVLTFNVTNSSTQQWTMSATINGSPVTFNGSDTFAYINGYANNAPLYGDPAAAYSNGASDANQLFLNEYGAGSGTFSDLVFTEVPEPSIASYLGLAVVGLVLLRRRVRLTA